MRKLHTYALVENNVVVNTIVADTAFILRQPGTWIEMGKSEGEKASPGFIRVQGKFVTPKPFEDWTLDSGLKWKAPKERPSEDHQWDENIKDWVDKKRKDKQ